MLAEHPANHFGNNSKDMEYFSQYPQTLSFTTKVKYNKDICLEILRIFIRDIVLRRA